MKTEITPKTLQEYFYSTKGFERPIDGHVVDYAEIEINPKGIKKLERNLERCGNPNKYTKEDWKRMNDPENDYYEHVIAYVHFKTGTEVLDELFIEVMTSYDSIPLVVENIINKKERKNIINAALKSIRKGNFS